MISPKLGDDSILNVFPEIVSADGQDHILMKILSSLTRVILPDLCVLIPGKDIYLYVFRNPDHEKLYSYDYDI